MRKKNIDRIFFAIFTIAGIAILTGGIYLLLSQTVLNKKNKIETTATITDIIYKKDENSSHIVYASHEVDGEEYESILSFYSSTFYIGKKIKAYYYENIPQKLYANGEKFTPYLMIILGSVFSVIGFIGVFYRIIKGNSQNKLKENGISISAEFMEIRRNNSYSVNDVHPYNIICKWTNPTTGENYIFKSENIWLNPKHIISNYNISHFTIYYNPNNIKKYYMDISPITSRIVDLT